ncbi:Sugar transferase involved in LPS biosynthesis (colanic, teichoic acid) [Nocardioides alpinus]|uniref:Sugar transferase n=1 Tax=Nocardioides alpinus TaxID=748909 RepID=A0A1I0WH88_9ACTN|nr:sugar transferase [Nocardioides alpinus]PKH37928.1 sugar transferase [Nocardioides alpinus]SFA88011.1 Sugar transferase involved in LPS biosynthesis (colanic, teichoic acid) [Nocardioides alpinus]
MDRGLVLKRAFDLAVSVPALVLSLPAQALTALAVRLTMGRPVLFRQRRPGLDGEVFELVKFRTMHHEDPARGRTDDASRLTATGRLLRKLSLDELPSLWNIVRGDMSLVGPRPLLERYLDRYSPEQARRHEVRPGLTGLAQVSGRNQVSWEDKLRLDVEYVDTRSFTGDLRILLATVRHVVRGTGVSADGEATMAEFRGTHAHGDRG